MCSDNKYTARIHLYNYYTNTVRYKHSEQLYHKCFTNRTCNGDDTRGLQKENNARSVKNFFDAAWGTARMVCTLGYACLPGCEN